MALDTPLHSGVTEAPANTGFAADPFGAGFLGGHCSGGLPSVDPRLKAWTPSGPNSTHPSPQQSVFRDAYFPAGLFSVQHTALVSRRTKEASVKSLAWPSEV